MKQRDEHSILPSPVVAASESSATASHRSNFANSVLESAAEDEQMAGGLWRSVAKWVIIGVVVIGGALYRALTDH